MPQAKRKSHSGTKTKVKSAAKRAPNRAKLTVGVVKRLQELSEAVGVSGDEGAIRKIVLNAIDGHVDQ